MATPYIYAKPTDNATTSKCVILDAKLGMRYPFHIMDWTHIRVGMAISWTRSGNNDNLDNNGTFTIVNNTDVDRFHFGVMQYSTKFPADDSGKYFVGLKTFGTNSYVSFPWSLISGTTGMGDTLKIGVSHKDGVQENVAGSNFWAQNSASWDDVYGYCAIFCLDLEIVNKGQANQQIIVKYNNQGIGSGAAAANTQNNIQTVMNSMSYFTAGTFDFQSGGVPYDLPDCVFLYSPVADARLRVFGINVIRLA